MSATSPGPEKTDSPTEGKSNEPPPSPTKSTDVEEAPKWRAPLVALMYAAFAIHAFTFTPSEPLVPEPDVLLSIIQGNWDSVNDLFLAIFLGIGVTAGAYASLLLPASKRQKKLPTSLFSVAGMGLGFLALGPYLAFRSYAPDVTAEEVEESGPLARAFESPIMGALLVLGGVTAYVVALGLLAPADVRDVVFYACCKDTAMQFATDRGVHVTLIDTVVLSVSMWGPLCEDMRRRGWIFNKDHISSYVNALVILAAPFLGPALYVATRPRLPRAKPKTE